MKITTPLVLILVIAGNTTAAEKITYQDHIGPGFLQQSKILGLRAWILAEVLTRAKLQRVDEDRQDDFVALIDFMAGDTQ